MWIGRPGYWKLRLPCALSGILTVCVTYFAGRRVFDEPTARIAAVVFAILPIATSSSIAPAVSTGRRRSSP